MVSKVLFNYVTSVVAFWSPIGIFFVSLKQSRNISKTFQNVFQQFCAASEIKLSS